MGGMLAARTKKRCTPGRLSLSHRYMRQRWYDPTLQRFISRDPLHSENRYSYAANNPSRFVDATGRQPNYPIANPDGSQIDRPQTPPSYYLVPPEGHPDRQPPGRPKPQPLECFIVCLVTSVFADDLIVVGGCKLTEKHFKWKIIKLAAKNFAKIWTALSPLVNSGEITGCWIKCGMSFPGPTKGSDDWTNWDGRMTFENGWDPITIEP